MSDFLTTYALTVIGGVALFAAVLFWRIHYLAKDEKR